MALAGTCFLLAVPERSRADSPILFNTNFEAGSLGKIEVLGENQFRCSVQGQTDERGRNRQANWYYFRMEGVKGRTITLTLADLVGEYNDKPGTCSMTAETIPVYSGDNEHWHHFSEMAWDDVRKEATLNFSPEHDRIWIAHLPPYPYSRLIRLLEQVDRSPWVRVELIGRSVQSRELYLATVTDFERSDQDKKVVWLQARQHAWETATSCVLEGALRFITSDDLQARKLRERVIFVFTPMLDPDGCATGKVRFNANGYDLNRHWDEIDLRRKDFLHQMPEIWYAKKAIVGFVNSGQAIDLMVNLHNTETNEYVETQAKEENEKALMHRFFDTLASDTSFDPSGPLRFASVADRTTNSLYKERRIPVLLMEQRIIPNRKLNRRLTEGDRLEFGRQLILAMARAVLR
jgi:hypothetical protein